MNHCSQEAGIRRSPLIEILGSGTEAIAPDPPTAIVRLTSQPYSRWRSRLVDQFLLAVEGGSNYA